MLVASSAGASALAAVLSHTRLLDILTSATALMRAQPTLLEVSAAAPCRVIVVGDTHGQFHDVCHLLDKFGLPSAERTYVFNGDYVDRGAWGVETLAMLLTLKLALPGHIHLLRGNHESAMCTRYYGFMAELNAKYGRNAKELYSACKRLFSQLPISALIQGNTLILHGGLFRHPTPPAPRNKQKRKRKGAAPAEAEVTIGTLQDLRASSKGGLDPDGRKQSTLATDVLWSDPSATEGLGTNDTRGVGLLFGPDITKAFLLDNKLRLVLRSHEGPDARDRRNELPNMLQGHSLDHETSAGNLMTVFSAPDYPQFIQDGDSRHNNLGAVAVLSAPDYCMPEMCTFSAVLPRPEATAYYDFSFPNSDEEMTWPEDGGSELGCSSAGGSSGCTSNVSEAQQEEHSPEAAAAKAANEASSSEQLPCFSHCTPHGVPRSPAPNLGLGPLAAPPSVEAGHGAPASLDLQRDESAAPAGAVASAAVVVVVVASAAVGSTVDTDSAAKDTASPPTEPEAPVASLTPGSRCEAQTVASLSQGSGCGLAVVAGSEPVAAGESQGCQSCAAAAEEAAGESGAALPRCNSSGSGTAAAGAVPAVDVAGTGLPEDDIERPARRRHQALHGEQHVAAADTQGP
ncbi:MAG: hypothetical protein WDW38_004250 [Sanguina aurantia]